MAKGYKRRSKMGNRQPRQIKIPAKARFMAFTQEYNGLTNKIVSAVGLTPAFDPKDYPDGNMPYAVTQKNALWDTGATNSVLTTVTVKELGLTAVGTTTVNHAGGTGQGHAYQSDTYLVNFRLPNHVGVVGVLVSECEDIEGNFGAIIGMDIIARGDFSITNVNQKTTVSFRVPSMRTIDYVGEHKRLIK